VEKSPLSVIEPAFILARRPFKRIDPIAVSLFKEISFELKAIGIGVFIIGSHGGDIFGHRSAYIHQRRAQSSAPFTPYALGQRFRGRLPIGESFRCMRFEVS